MPEATHTAVSTVRGLSVDLGGTSILQDVDLDVRPGEWLGLVGPNGSGKTTLLRAIAGLAPYRGSIQIDGRELRTMPPPETARRIAFMRQSMPLSFDLTVSDIAILGRSPHHRWLEPFGHDDRALLAATLKELDLTDKQDRVVSTLSGGEAQRVFLAQALLQEPRLLLLDEPTAHLDVHHQFRFCELVRARMDGVFSAVTAFHDLELAARYTDRILVLAAGRVAALGPADEVITRELIARVFRMDSRVDRTEPGAPSIRYTAPLRRNESS